MFRSSQLGQPLKRGRKPVEERRSVRLRFYVTVNDADRIYQLVLRRKVTLSALIRDLLLELIGPSMGKSD